MPTDPRARDKTVLLAGGIGNPVLTYFTQRPNITLSQVPCGSVDESVEHQNWAKIDIFTLPSSYGW